MNIQISDDFVITGALPGPGISFTGIAQRALSFPGTAQRAVAFDGSAQLSVSVTGTARRVVEFDARWQFIDQEG